MTDVEKGSLNDFSFKLHGKTHHLQAQTKAEKDGWLVAIETKLAGAKASREGIVGSSGYKSALEKYGRLRKSLSNSPWNSELTGCRYPGSWYHCGHFPVSFQTRKGQQISRSHD